MARATVLQEFKSVRIPADAWELGMIEAKKRRVHLRDLVADAIREYLKAPQQPNARRRSAA